MNIVEVRSDACVWQWVVIKQPIKLESVTVVPNRKAMRLEAVIEWPSLQLKDIIIN